MALPKSMNELSTLLKDKSPVESRNNRDALVALRMALRPDPLNVKELTKDIIDRKSFASRQLRDEVKTLPMHLMETVAFFTNFWHGDKGMDDHCVRPAGTDIPYPGCSCIVSRCVSSEMGRG
ncbi:hypothetical protein Droror1_Dr00006268 [Drosera rotundifolia]